jgi:hypothetical protein
MTTSNHIHIDDQELSFRPQRSEAQRKEVMEVNLQTRYNHLVQVWDNPEFEIPSFEAWCYSQSLDDSEPNSIQDMFKDQDIFKIFETIVIHLDPAKLTLINQGNCAMTGMYYQKLFNMDNRYARRIGDLVNHYSKVPPLV